MSTIVNFFDSSSVNIDMNYEDRNVLTNLTLRWIYKMNDFTGIKYLN